MIKEFFSTPVYEDIIEVNNNEIINYSYEVNKIIPTVKKSNIIGYQSDSLCQSDIVLQPLIKNIFDKSKILLNYFNVKKTLTLKLLNIWVNINPRGGSNCVHNHPGSFVSGVYYVQVPENSGNLILTHPAVNYEYHSNNHTIEKWNDKNGARVIVIPQAGKLVLFPGWANHYVEPNDSENHRISLAFNVGFKENIMA